MGWWRGGVEVGIDGLRFDLRGGIGVASLCFSLGVRVR